MEDAVRALQQQVNALMSQNAALETQLVSQQNIAQSLAELPGAITTVFNSSHAPMRRMLDLAIREGLPFYQTRSNAIILQGTLPAYCIPKVERLKTGEVLYERRYLSPRPPPKVPLRHDHNWTRGNDQLGSTVEQQPVGKLVQQSFGEAPRVKLSQQTQPKPNPICDRSGKPEDTEHVFVDKGKTSRSHEIDDKRLHKELGSSEKNRETCETV